VFVQTAPVHSRTRTAPICDHDTVSAYRGEACEFATRHTSILGVAWSYTHSWTHADTERTWSTPLLSADEADDDDDANADANADDDADDDANTDADDADVDIHAVHVSTAVLPQRISGGPFVRVWWSDYRAAERCDSIRRC
jgi:hypothetical protein